MPNDEATLTYCHAWHDSAAGDVKGNYKFPHHKTKGGAAFTAGCSAGLGRLDQADIPEADVAGVKAHLQAHLDDDKDDSDGDPDDHAHPHTHDQISRPVFAQRPANREFARAGTDRADHPAGSAVPWKFWNAKAAPAGSDTDELWIYDEISFWGISAQDFAQDLALLKGKNLTLRLNSPGGDVFDGLAIKNLIADHPANVTVKVDALAASIASVIAQAGDKVIMGNNSQMMIHDASGMAMGDAGDMRDMAALLDMISDNIAGVYAQRAGGEADDWRKTMKDEKWYTADEAVAAGLADSVVEPPAQRTPAEAEPDDAPDTKQAARALKLAASWCDQLFPTHAAPFRNAVAALPIDQADPPSSPPSGASGSASQPLPGGDSTTALPAPAAQRPTGAALAPVQDAAPVAIELDLAHTIRSAIAPPTIDIADWRALFGDMPTAGLASNEAPKLPPPVLPPVEPPLKPVRPALASWIDDALAGASINRPEPVPRPAAPKDLGPLPERVEPTPEPRRPALAELIGGAVTIARNDCPEPDAPLRPDDRTPTNQPFRLDVNAVRRAVREARF